jgi:hypothetical protein
LLPTRGQECPRHIWSCNLKLRALPSPLPMIGAHSSIAKNSAANASLLFTIFFLISCGLGYPILNRFDPRQTPGLSDVKTYAALVDRTPIVNDDDLRFRHFRVLVPWVAKPFFLIARGRIASWNPVMFGLLVADSLFVAGTALLIVFLGSSLDKSRTGNPAMGLVAALLYLVNFAVPNLRLVGLVDAGEGFFLLALLWSLTRSKLWMLPAIAVLGTLTKESFVPFSIAFTAAWLVSSRKESDGMEDAGRVRNSVFADGVWILLSWAASVIAMIVLQWSIAGRFVSPLQFGLGLHRTGGYDFAAVLRDRNLWYSFLWLLPMSLPYLRRFPKSWLIPVGATCVTAVALDAYFGAAPGILGRVLFSIAGPVLSLSAALFLLRISGQGAINHS